MIYNNLLIPSQRALKSQPLNFELLKPDGNKVKQNHTGAWFSEDQITVKNMRFSM